MSFYLILDVPSSTHECRWPWSTVEISVRRFAHHLCEASSGYVLPVLFNTAVGGRSWTMTSPKRRRTSRTTAWARLGSSFLPPPQPSSLEKKILHKLRRCLLTTENDYFQIKTTKENSIVYTSQKHAIIYSIDVSFHLNYINTPSPICFQTFITFQRKK